MSESMTIHFPDDVDVTQISSSLQEITPEFEFRDVGRGEATLALPRDMEDTERQKVISSLKRLGIQVA